MVLAKRKVNENGQELEEWWDAKWKQFDIICEVDEMPATGQFALTSSEEFWIVEHTHVSFIRTCDVAEGCGVECRKLRPSP